ncbi:mCG146215, partial [Mus musculus]
PRLWAASPSGGLPAHSATPGCCGTAEGPGVGHRSAHLVERTSLGGADWLGTHYEDQAGLTVQSLLPLPPDCLDYRCAPPCPSPISSCVMWCTCSSEEDIRPLDRPPAVTGSCELSTALRAWEHQQAL